MPTCPNCKGDFPRRKDDACPGCGVPIEIIDSRWIATKGDISPTKVILDYFCTLVTERETARFGRPVPFRIPRRGERYRRELRGAARLFADAEEDLELALHALLRLFRDHDLAWKNRTSLLTLGNDYVLALARERSVRERDAHERARERELAEQLRERAHIFSE